MTRAARRTGASPAGGDYPGAVRSRRQVRNASLVACALALAVVALGAATGSAAPTQATSGAPASRACAPKVGTAGPFVGVNAPDSVLGNARFRACAFNALVKAHVGLVRDVFYWAGIELAPGFYDFSRTDAYVADAARHGLQVLPVILMAPGFRSTASARNPKPGFYPPRNPDDLGAFAAVLAKRYGPNGDFWAQHPDVPKVPIRSWQIWNEPNLPVYWADGPSPSGYTAMLKAAATAIRGVDPSADIVSAGLPYSKDRRTLSPERFLRGMYAAGAKGSFTTLAVHPYSDTVSRMVVALNRMRRVLNAAGDTSVPIWVTEVGWASGGPPSVFTVTPRRQAQLLSSTVRTLSRKRNSTGIKGLVVHTLRDQRPGANTHDYWGLHAGLFNLRGKAKPALAALGKAAKHVPA
jgi:polysaccharide biosynthesis protein PslG